MKKSMILGMIYLLAALLAVVAAAQTTPKPQTAPASKPSASPAAKPAASPTPAPQASNSPLKTEKEKVSYALGMNLGENLHRQGVEMDPETFLQGMKDAMGGGKTLMTDEEARASLIQLQNEMRAKQQEQQKLAAETNKKEGDAFLAANKAKGGVVTLPSGLQYKILTPGTGPKPTATDTVSCNYRGTLINGKEFDSNARAGKPVTFPVNGVIKGWTEALQLMPVGSKWELWIPPELAYGEQQRGPDIGPNSTLVFEVELVSIQPKNQPELKNVPEPQSTPQPKSTPEPKK